MPSPVRRSARAAQPPTKPAPPTSNTSSSSLSSARQDRTSKTNNANQKSATPHSLSSEDASEPPRRSQRAHALKDEGTVEEEAIADEPAADEEEVTRCVCGYQEYMGPPLSEAFSGVDALTDETGGWFIQCDGCHVWQHGGCVGIVDEDDNPEKYYCEECRPKLHELHVDPRGRNYSLYTPMQQKSSRKGSISKSDDKAKRERETTASRASADPGTGRRRATMRSKEHDDEEEQLRRALEESKREVEGGGNGKRNGKRGRDDTEEVKKESKRQRRASESMTSISRTATMDDESDGDTMTASRFKKARADATQSARQAELREKEKERERARAEAANRRQDRAGRRRVDEHGLDDDTPRPDTSARSSPPASSQPPSPPTFAVPDKAPQRKGPGKKVKKLGNNQYTKNRGLQGATSSPHGRQRQFANNHGGSSGDEQMANGDSHPTNTSNSTTKNSPGHETGNGKPAGKFGKGKGKAVNGHKQAEDPPEMSIPNMNRAMDSMSLFMQRAQVEMAGDRTPPLSDGPKGNLGDAAMLVVPGGPVQPAVTSAPDERPFEELSSMEMADVLARKYQKWKEKFGHLA